MTSTRSDDGATPSTGGPKSKAGVRGIVPAALSLIVPGLGAAYLGAWRRAASSYAFGFALTGLLFLELRPQIAVISRYVL